MSALFFAGQEIIEIKQEQLDQLKRAAVQAPLKRTRFCLHPDHSDLVQEMVIAFTRDSYVRPHRHKGKSESFHIIEGELRVVFFDDIGRVTRSIKMGWSDRNDTFLYRLCTDQWHTVVPLSDFVIVHETTTGPFIEGATEFAPWEPNQFDTEAVGAFLNKLKIENWNE